MKYIWGITAGTITWLAAGVYYELSGDDIFQLVFLCMIIYILGMCQGRRL
jgi:hypothetical protein